MLGRSLPVSIPRRIVTDYVRLSATIPSIPIERTMDLGAVAAARNACSPRPPWVALFGKAFALTAQELPELRRVFLKWPWPHLYEYPASVAMFAIDRVYHDEPVVLPRMVKNPAAWRIGDLAQMIRDAKAAPLDEIKCLPLRNCRDRCVGCFGGLALASGGNAATISALSWCRRCRRSAPNSSIRSPWRRCF